jgi:hypothetical protein
MERFVFWKFKRRTRTEIDEDCKSDLGKEKY